MLSYKEEDLLFQGAESKVYASYFYGTPAVTKVRFEKRFRNRQLDEKLREQRTLREARAMVRCRRHHIRAPTLYFVNRKACTLCMERITGTTVKDVLDGEEKRLAAAASPTAPAKVPSPLVQYTLRGLGHTVAQMHMADIIHGDLTTSNFIFTASAERQAALQRGELPVTSSSADMVVIDFGLVQEKTSDEERAVDLYVLERAMLSTHNYLEDCAAQLILTGYTDAMERVAAGEGEGVVDVKVVRNAKKHGQTLQRLALVRARGRKRSMVG